MPTEIKYCKLPGCSRIVTNWRMSCCCKSHQGTYSAKCRHGTIDKPDAQGNTGHNYIPKTISQRKSEWSAYVVLRRKKRDRSMPAWANKDKILEFYIRARQLTLETGVPHEVDHIIPSNHKLVCGLHCEYNLQILPRDVNRRKNNKFVIE